MSLVISLFDFSSLILPKSIAAQQCRIESIQKKFTQILLQHKKPLLNYKQRLETLGLSTLQRRFDRGIIHFQQKLILSNHNQLIGMPIVNGKFQERDLYTDLSSFSGKKYQVTRSTMDAIFQNSLHYYGTRLFNDVPHYLKANSE